MRGLFALVAVWLLSFNVHAQCEVETSLPDLGETGATLDYTTNLMPADWRFEGPDGVRIFEGSPISVPFTVPGTYSAVLAGQNGCEETIRIEFQVRIFDMMGTPEISINGGAEYTNDFRATVDLTASGAVEYLLSDNSNCRTGEWKPMAASAPWELPFENQEGRVFAKFRTPIEESACVSDSIVHDDILPTVNLVTAPDSVTNELNARFVFDPQDSGSGIDTMLCGMLGPANQPCDNDSTFQVPEGTNTLVFQARDNAGNIGAVMLYEWRVDITKPTVEITSAPASLTNQTSARFEFAGADESSEITGYTCQLDSSVVACDSPETYSNLADGSHRFAVIAEDEAGNKSDPAIHEWNIDSVAPVISFVRTPAAWEASTTTTIEVAVNDASASTVRCRLDNAAFQDCTLVSPLSNLAEGGHSFEAFAVDAAGNQSETITHNWSVDTTAPTVVFTSVPENPNSDLEVQIGFNANDAGIGLKEIRCQFDNDPVFTCQSPLDITNLSIGEHTIQVFAIDELDNTSAPISYTWETRVAPPVVAIVHAPEAETNSTEASIGFVAQSDVTIAGYECSVDNAAFSSCVSPLNLTNLVDGNHTVSVRATDEFGQLSNTATHNWFIDSTAPVLVFTEVPDPVIDVPDALVKFMVTENGSGIASIECQFDGQDFEECQSPYEAADMSEGPHSFTVRATDRLGNVSDAISTGWEVNLTVPVVVFTQVPDLETPMTEAEFKFEADSNLGIDRIECSIDGSAFSVCVSPAVVENLSVGSHQFSVIAYDTLNRPSETITHTWAVVKLPDVIEEEFVSEGGSRKLDLLFVVDNSGSMYKELTSREVRRNFKGILDELKGLDWRVGLTTTDGRGRRPGEEGRLVPFYRLRKTVMTPETKKPESRLIDTITRLRDGANYEEGISVLQQSVDRHTDGTFLRDDAVFMAIIVSDEDEASSGNSSKPKNQPEVLLQKVQDRWGEDKIFQAHGVIWRAEDRGCRNAQKKGRVYSRLISMTNGKSHSICRSRYANGLKGYADLAKAGDIVRELKCSPIDGNIEVSYNPEPSKRPKLTLAGSSLRFSPAPPNGTLVKLKYSCATSLKEIVSLKRLK